MEQLCRPFACPPFLLFWQPPLPTLFQEPQPQLRCRTGVVPPGQLHQNCLPLLGERVHPAEVRLGEVYKLASNLGRECAASRQLAKRGLQLLGHTVAVPVRRQRPPRLQRNKRPGKPAERVQVGHIVPRTP